MNRYINCTKKYKSLKIIKNIKFINGDKEIELKELKNCIGKIDHDINLSFLLLFYNNIHYFENSNISIDFYITNEVKNTTITKNLLLSDAI